MFEFVKNNRRPLAAMAAAGALALASSGCSGQPGSAPIPSHSVTQTEPPVPTIETVCQPDYPDGWVNTPSNVNVEDVASQLHVPLEAITQGGRFGSAICKKQLSMDRIGSETPPVVSVTNEGSPCLVIGTQGQPVPGKFTSKILAICANPSYLRNSA